MNRMDDLISRQAAIEIVDRYNKSHMILQGKPMLGAASIVIELEALPSAQPVPITVNIDHELTQDEYVKLCKDMANAPIVLLPSAQPERKKGQWQEDPSGYGFWICSACGFVSEASGADLLYNFCPNCGADMRGEQDDSV